MALPLGLLLEISELLPQVQLHFLVLGYATGNFKVSVGFDLELLRLHHQLLVEFLVLVAQFSVQAVDLVYLTFELEPQADLFAEGLRGRVVFID